MKENTKSRIGDCKGGGIVKHMTNEEWFCGLSTEEKAEWIIYKQGLATKWGWVEWLRREHKEGF